MVLLVLGVVGSVLSHTLVYLIEVHVVVFILPQCNGKGQFSCHIQNFRAAGRSSAVCVCVCVCVCVRCAHLFVYL
jgi:hypothetical protein